MKAKFLLSSLLVALLGAQLSAISYDFNVGYGFGFDYGLRTNPKDLSLAPLALPDVPAKDISQFTWSTGGFIGGGVSFEGDFTQSVGLQYTGKYIANTQKYTYNLPAVAGGARKADVKVEAMDNFLDVYYKVGLMKTIPMDLQVNLGLVSRFLVGTTINGKHIEGLTEPPVAFGVHAGLRYNVHMFFLGVDYSYIPSYDYPAKTASLIPGALPGVSSAKDAGFNAHSVSVSMGVIFNKAILDSFTK